MTMPAMAPPLSPMLLGHRAANLIVTGLGGGRERLRPRGNDCKAHKPWLLYMDACHQGSCCQNNEPDAEGKRPCSAHFGLVAMWVPAIRAEHTTTRHKTRLPATSKPPRTYRCVSGTWRLTLIPEDCSRAEVPRPQTDAQTAQQQRTHRSCLLTYRPSGSQACRASRSQARNRALLTLQSNFAWASS